MRSTSRRLVVGAAFLGTLLLFAAWLLPPSRSASSTILITGVYYDTYLTDDPDEAFRLMNVSDVPVDLTNWMVTDGPTEGAITLQDTLPAGASIWIAREAVAFTAEFGFPPDYEHGDDTDPAVPNLAATGSFLLANDGDEIVVKNSGGDLIDSIVYEGGDPADTGWLGEAVYPYGGDAVGLEPLADPEDFARKGQVLYRKLDQATGLPVSDTDTVADWAQATDDNINGKKVMYPGWDLDRYFFTDLFTETASIAYAVAPDNIYETVLAEINQAATSIYYEGYTFNNAHLADTIVARMQANPGMTVTLLLEGEPVGGIEDQEKWICQQIEEAGGQVYFMYNDEAAEVHDRYTYQHGKWMIIDGQTLLTGSEDLSYSSMPADDKTDGTEGNRGVWLITDAPSAIAHALDVFQHDLDPANHKDLFRWTAGDPTYGAPPPGFVPDYSSGGTSYAIQFPTPLTLSGTFSFEMVQSPENSLRDQDSLLGMVARAGSGDTVLVEQLYEYTFWGPTTSNPTDDPNPRLEAYIAAARRGAKVRILLDSAYDDPGDVRGNTATCAYVDAIAASEGLDLDCKLANPAGTGIHNKMVLVLDGGTGYVHTGSINGSENSSKGNRELAVQVRSDAAYDYLAQVFWYDWGVDGDYFAYLPVVLRNLGPPLPHQPTLFMISNPDGDGAYNVSWTEEPFRRADTYTLEEALDPSFSSGLQTVCTTADQSCDVTDRLAGTYYYRVRGYNGYGYGPYSNTQSVTVLPPEPPELYDIDNADGDGNYTVSWSASPQATDYTLEEDTSSSFPNPTTVYQGADLSTPVTNQAPGTYYYRVRANGPTGPSEWSNIEAVTVDPLPVPDLYILDIVYAGSDERIVIENQGTGAQNMTDWEIQSVVGDQWYTFPDGYTLDPGASVYVHSGPDAYESPPTHLLWAYSYIWYNDGDEAILYNSDDDVIDSYVYPPPPQTIEYLNYDGQQTTEEWFRDEFGEFIIEELPNTEYRVDVMAAATGYAAFRMRVLDENRDPVADYPVDWYWPDGHVPGQTNAEGWADFAMGGGAYYQPDLGEIGPHWVTVSDTTIRGIGMILFTPHNHFDVVVWAGQPASLGEYSLTLNVDGSGTAQGTPRGHRTQRVPR
jgi:cardiolipin synthase